MMTGEKALDWLRTTATAGEKIREKRNGGTQPCSLFDVKHASTPAQGIPALKSPGDQSVLWQRDPQLNPIGLKEHLGASSFMFLNLPAAAFMTQILLEATIVFESHLDT
ncbi:hypothetical protein AV530_015129 [Patagioenas fasciata monilis]|uniref:Uncharacterized protein n=1 Tax=Patagioenas fasciata monilis TaxID=372326 RepID=A0A1V4K169_PATFA|nr:hypothetical protein AV530_015129 [Patagioenas fasciata monilis]